MGTAETAKARSTAIEAKIAYQAKKFYHADGYIKAIGKNARRTIYSSNARIRLKWQLTLQYLIEVRKNAAHKIYLLKHPQPYWPPHHSLWTCISRYEGSPTSVNPNGHYGMLQMTWNWLGYIKGAANNYPQVVQEWAAEHAYAANGFSHSFLYGQWFNYDGAATECLQFA